MYDGTFSKVIFFPISEEVNTVTNWLFIKTFEDVVLIVNALVKESKGDVPGPLFLKVKSNLLVAGPNGSVIFPLTLILKSEWEA